MTNAIFTDLDGVIRMWPPETHIQIEQAVGLPEGAIPRAAFSGDLLSLVVTGQISDDEWRRRIADLLLRKYPGACIKHAVELWSISPGKVNLEVLEIFRSSRKKAQLVLVTNATSRLNSDLQRLGISEDFDHIVNSSEVGHAKPDPGIFLAALNMAGIAPEQALFIDDNTDLVEAATRLGLSGHVFESANALRHKLLHLGLLQTHS